MMGCVTLSPALNAVLFCRWVHWVQVNEQSPRPEAEWTQKPEEQNWYCASTNSGRCDQIYTLILFSASEDGQDLTNGYLCPAASFQAGLSVHLSLTLLNNRSMPYTICSASQAWLNGITTIWNSCYHPDFGDGNTRTLRAKSLGPKVTWLAKDEMKIQTHVGETPKTKM